MAPIDLVAALRLLADHEAQAATTLNMTPSENRLSTLAKLPLLLDPYHRYFFNDRLEPDGWAFPGGRLAAGLETELTIPLLRELAGARHVNVRPLSGLHAMLLVFAALGGPPGATVIHFGRELGGHYATAAVAGRLGLRPVALCGPDPHRPDLDRLQALCRRHQPRLVYVDQSYCLFPADIAALCQAVRDAAPATRVHADVSHWMGLVLGGQFPNPLACGADSFGGSTHKTFPGPQKGIVATDDPTLARQLRDTQFYLISSHHFAATLSLGLALLEFRDCGGATYAAQVVANGRRLGQSLQRHGLPVEAADRGFTAGHQLWVRPVRVGVDAAVAADRLYQAGIRVNVLDDLPHIPEPALRVGVNEPTWLGLGAQEVEELAWVFAATVLGRRPLARLRAQITALRRRTSPPFQFPTDTGPVGAEVAELLRAHTPPQPLPAAAGSHLHQ